MGANVTAWWLALLVVSTPAQSREHSAIMTGAQSATFQLGSATPPVSYRNHGFAQVVEDGLMVVRVDAEGSQWTRYHFELPDDSAVKGAIGAFAVTAARGARTRAEAVARVLHAVASQVVYRSHPSAPTAPVAVLESRSGGCVGRSNLAVAALLELGIPARVARGLLFDASTGAATPHRWLEVFFPDCGWVFSDPTESIHYVSPLHLVLTPPSDPDPDYAPSTAAAPRWLATTGELIAVDLHPARESALSERRNSDLQFAATVYGRLRGSGPWNIRLRGQGLEREITTLGSMFSFPGLTAGSYWLEGRSSVGDLERVPVSLRDAELLRLEVQAP